MEYKVLTKPDIEDILKKYWPNRNSPIFYIPFDEFGVSNTSNDFRVLQMSAIMIREYLRILFECQYVICYNFNKISYYVKASKIRAKYSVQIPYGSRSKYITFIARANKLISADGLSQLFVNNIPYNLDSYYVIETKERIPEVEALIKEYRLELRTDKGFNKFFDEAIQYRKWQPVQIGSFFEKADIKAAFSMAFAFPEIAALEEKGYCFKVNITRKKVFISYCHNNKDVVLRVVDELERRGANIWIDKKDITVGDNILESICNGIKESDLHLLFLSCSTLKSQFAQYELKSIMSEMICSSRPWYIVKLDEINPNDAMFSLNDYLYYDFTINPSIEDLASDIMKKLKQIK
ncbi:MAG: toll/interleukin-1 receptor domain-containing protein [Acetanaerobacterium sp.]